jgi:hypothetical protein
MDGTAVSAFRRAIAELIVLVAFAVVCTHQSALDPRGGLLPGVCSPYG